MKVGLPERCKECGYLRTRLYYKISFLKFIIYIPTLSIIEGVNHICKKMGDEFQEIVKEKLKEIKNGNEKIK